MHLGDQGRSPAARQAAAQGTGVQVLIEQGAERQPQGRAAGPGRKRIPAITEPGGDETSTGPVSGPARDTPLPARQMRSVQASGRTRVGGAPAAGVTDTHTQDTARASAAGGAYPR